MDRTRPDLKVSQHVNHVRGRYVSTSLKVAISVDPVRNNPGFLRGYCNERVTPQVACSNESGAGHKFVVPLISQLLRSI